MGLVLLGDNICLCHTLRHALSVRLFSLSRLLIPNGISFCTPLLCCNTTIAHYIQYVNGFGYLYLDAPHQETISHPILHPILLCNYCEKIKIIIKEYFTYRKFRQHKKKPLLFTVRAISFYFLVFFVFLVWAFAKPVNSWRNSTKSS